MSVVGVLKQIELILKAMDEQRQRDWLNKVNSKPRKKRSKNK